MVDALMKAISAETDPQKMVELYGDAVDKWYPVEEWMSLSRRGLAHPEYRITRSSRLPQDINPWKERHRLPLLRGGFLAEVLYSDRPWVLETPGLFQRRIIARMSG